MIRRVKTTVSPPIAVDRQAKETPASVSFSESAGPRGGVVKDTA